MDDSARPSAPDPTLHPADTWWTVLFIDHFAIRLLRLVRNLAWVTPMRITLLAHALGVITAVLFARGDLVAAAVLYEVRFTLDCIDGKLARTRGTASKLGAYVDFVGDYIITTLNFAGVGLWLLWTADVNAVLAFGPAFAFSLHMAVRLSTEAQGTMPQLLDAAPGRYAAWMAQRRLLPGPSRIDFEHGFLFIAPVVAHIADEPRIITWSAVLVTVYFAYVLSRFFSGGMALARRTDDAAR